MEIECLPLSSCTCPHSISYLTAQHPLLARAYMSLVYKRTCTGMIVAQNEVVINNHNYLLGMPQTCIWPASGQLCSSSLNTFVICGAILWFYTSSSYNRGGMGENQYDFITLKRLREGSMPGAPVVQDAPETRTLFSETIMNSHNYDTVQVCHNTFYMIDISICKM